jgi:NADH-quinone oxidoreductase subunit I
VGDVASAVKGLEGFIRGFVAVLQGLGVTMLNLVGRRKVTLQYPFERRQVSPRYRGLFYLPYDEEAERLKCVGCTLCAQACPTKVITMEKLGSGKHAGVREFRMDLGRCMFCNLCIEACPFDAIHMGPEYELASYDRNASVFTIKELAQGGPEAVKKNIETIETALREEKPPIVKIGVTPHVPKTPPASDRGGGAGSMPSAGAEAG